MPIVLCEESYKANIMELNRRRFQNYLFVQIGNKKGFIVSQNPRNIESLSNQVGFLALLSTDEKIPLYKQDMMLRMGQVPKSTRSVRRNCNVRVLDMDTCQERYFYSVWSIR